MPIYQNSASILGLRENPITLPHRHLAVLVWPWLEGGVCGWAPSILFRTFTPHPAHRQPKSTPNSEVGHCTTAELPFIVRCTATSKGLTNTLSCIVTPSFIDWPTELINNSMGKWFYSPFSLHQFHCLAFVSFILNPSASSLLVSRIRLSMEDESLCE